MMSILMYYVKLFCSFIVPRQNLLMKSGGMAYIGTTPISIGTRAGTNTPSDEYDTYRDTGWRIRYVSRIHFFSEAKLGNG